MMFRRHRHSVPLLNTTSTADISFMLLIFFLVTTSMDVDKGLRHQLPPAERQRQEESTAVNKADMLALTLTADGRLLADGHPSTPAAVAAEAERLIGRVGRRNIITIEAEGEADSNLYFETQNALADMYRRLRNRVARRRFGRPYGRCDASQREVVDRLVPQRVSESYTGAASASPAPAARPASPASSTPVTAAKGGRP